MIAEKILGKKPVSLAQAREMVKERLKTAETPTYEQDMTLQYVEKFAKLSRAKAEKLADELCKLEGVDRALAVKIADLLPSEKPVLELLIIKKYKLTDAVMQSILDAVQKHIKS